MTEPNQSNNWDTLLSELGVEAKPEDGQPQTRTVPDSRQFIPQKKTPNRQKPQPQQVNTGGWDALAAEFGLQSVAEQPAPPAAEEIGASPSAALPTPDATEKLPVEQPEESPNFYNERFDFEEPYDLLESSSATEAPESEPQLSAEPNQRRGRRKRRRRKPGQGDRPRAAADVSTPPAVGAILPEGAETKEVSTSDDAEDKAMPEKRSKRRRGRRGRKRHPAEPVAVGVTSPTDDSLDSSTASEENPSTPDAGALGAESAEGDTSVRTGFRGIPTWEEVVGIVIGRNMEQRAKHPGGGNHGRGNRGQRDNRGGAKPRPS